MPFKSLIKEFQDLKDGLGSISRRSFDIKFPIYHHRSRSMSSVLDESQARTVHNVEISEQSCWATMPPELLRDVLQRVETSESTWPSRKHFVACACVCRNWRNVAKELTRPPEHSKKLTFPISVKQFYPSLNRRCCSKAICTECYLQIKSARFARSTQCPFCKTSSYTVEFCGAKTVEEKGFEQAEEQKVIEEKIRIRQKELHDEAERVRKLGEDTQAEPFEHETNHMLMEPSMSAPAAQVQGPVHRLTKSDGLDQDIEDMMLMEAIWLSIQEQGEMYQEFALAQQIPTLSPLSEKGFFDSNEISTEIAGRTGGLTRAITALADQVVNSSRNLLGSDQSLNASHNDTQSHKFRDLATRSCTIDPLRRNSGADRALQKEKQDISWEKRQDGEHSWQTASCGSEELNGWLNVSKGNSFWSSVQREGRDFTFDQSSSEAVEAGTSFSSSIPSASELPWEAPDQFHSSRSSDNVGETSLSTASTSMLPVSFEDQIMMAMALSLADAQAEARIRNSNF